MKREANEGQTLSRAVNLGGVEGAPRSVLYTAKPKTRPMAANRDGGGVGFPVIRILITHLGL